MIISNAKVLVVFKIRLKRQGANFVVGVVKIVNVPNIDHQVTSRRLKKFVDIGHVSYQLDRSSKFSLE